MRAAVIFALGFLSAVACYKGDPGYGNVDYPPEPPFTMTCADAGRE